MQFTPELIEEIRSRNDIVDVIGQYVHLEKKGSNYMGLCPFHNEKSPSFSVSQSKQMYHCFGCGVGGDVFSFLQRYNSLTFPEAVKELADRSGVALSAADDTEEARKERSQRQLLYDINKEAAKYYFYELRGTGGKTGLDYFQKRKLSNETMQKFGLGYSPVGAGNLVNYLRKKGYSDEIMILAGLASHDEKRGTHDVFWNRVMFPIFDINNRVIGFGGRVLGDAKPKYVNTNDTPIFNKRRNLYGLSFAKNSKAGNFILCEGYMDVIAMHQAGFTQAVASLGTAFTAEQAQLIKRYTQEVILSYDSDGPGVKAELRAIQILKEAGLRGKALNLEPYKDPDEFIKNEGQEAFEKRLRNAENTFFFEIRIMQRDYDMTDPAGKTAYYRAVARRLCEFSESLERENYIQATAAKLAIPIGDLKNLVVSIASEGITSKQPGKDIKAYQNQRRRDPKDNILRPQRLLLTWIADEPDIYKIVKKYISPDDFTDELYRKVAEKMYEGLDAGRFLAASILSLFPDDEEQQSRVSEIFNTNLVRIETREEKEKALHDIIYDIRRMSYEKKKSEIQLGDANALKTIVDSKKKLEELAHSRIGLD
ncbi:DNA primase [Butyrivibrio fibrisolvens]|uniref:DNA primase n=1 Tax=Butyrivibrio fibrisolvens TaxID=831 RepID=UPI0004856580|nr:DNA primase [Butyrivibrio fibrisolvens]